MWNNFQRAQKGSGYSKKELSQLYKKFRNQTGGGVDDLVYELRKNDISPSNIDELGLDIFTGDRSFENEHGVEVNYDRLSITCYPTGRYGMVIYNGPSVVAGPYSYQTLGLVISAIKYYI